MFIDGLSLLWRLYIFGCRWRKCNFGPLLERHWQGESKVLKENSLWVKFCTLQIPYGLSWDRIWASTLKDRWLTALRHSTAPLRFRKFDNNCLLGGSYFFLFGVQKSLGFFFFEDLGRWRRISPSSSETSGSTVTFRKSWIVILNVIMSPFPFSSSIPAFIDFKRLPSFITVYINFLRKRVCKSLQCWHIMWCNALRIVQGRLLLSSL